MLGRYLPAEACVNALNEAILDYKRSLKRPKRGYFRGKMAKDDWYVQWSDNDGIPVDEVPFLRFFLREAVPMIQPSIEFATAIAKQTKGNPSDLATVQETPEAVVHIVSDHVGDDDHIYYSLRMSWDRAVFIDRLVRDRLEPYPYLAQLFGPWSLVDIFEHLQRRLRREALRSEYLFGEDTVARASKLRFVEYSKMPDGYAVVTEDLGRKVITLVHWNKTECPVCKGFCAHELRFAWELFAKRRFRRKQD